MPPRPALMDEIVEEILFRVPPDDPKRLLRAALVCKRWCRIVSAACFRRRYREFHRTPPMLGFLRNVTDLAFTSSFVSTSSFRTLPADRINGRAIDARHGRVLLSNLHSEYDGDGGGVHLREHLMVWDPITGKSSELPLPRWSRTIGSVTWNAAVLCASAGGACDHLDCGSGHFLVVLVGKSWSGMFAHVYSSESAAWCEHVFAEDLREDIPSLPSALAGHALYFMCSKNVLKCDLAAREMSLIPLPGGCLGRNILRTTEDGRLGLANMSSSGLYLSLWSREVGPDEDVEWAKSKVIVLTKLLPDVPICSLRRAGFAYGLDVILVGSMKGTFTIDLKSDQATKVHEEDCCDVCYPYLSFYTPALGASSAEGSSSKA